MEAYLRTTCYTKKHQCKTDITPTPDKLNGGNSQTGTHDERRTNLLQLVLNRQFEAGEGGADGRLEAVLKVRLAAQDGLHLLGAATEVQQTHHVVFALRGQAVVVILQRQGERRGGEVALSECVCLCVCVSVMCKCACVCVCLYCVSVCVCVGCL